MPNNSKREYLIFKNTAILYARMLFSILIGLYTSRLVLQALGVSDYGIYNVVGGVTTMFMFLNGSMSVATSRFITFELGKGRLGNLATIYHQAVIIHRIIAFLVFLLIEIVGTWFLNYKMNIPADRIFAANCVLQTVACTSILDIIATPDIALIISYERMKSFALISILGNIMTCMASFILLAYHHDRLILYAIMVMFIQMTLRISYFVYCRKNFKETQIKANIDKETFHHMISFAGWNVGGNLALITIDQGINILLNLFFGPIVNAARGISMQISNYLTTFINNIRMAINPQITKSYALGDKSYMLKLMTYSSLSCYFLLLLISSFLYWILDYVLNIWLVEVPTGTALFINLTFVYLMINSFANPVIIGIHATGVIKKFQITEGCIMLLTLPLAYIFLKNGAPAFSVYISQIIIAILAQMGRLYIVLPSLGIPLHLYVSLILWPATKVTATVFVVSLVLTLTQTHIDTFLYTIIQCIGTTSACITAIMYIGLNEYERKYFINNIIYKLLKQNHS